MARHLMLLTTFFMQPHPGAPALHIDIVDLHLDHCAHAGEGVDHQADQRTVAQACDDRGIDGIDQRSRLIGGQHGRFAMRDRVPGTARRGGWVDGYRLTHHQPVEQYAQSGELQFD